MKEITKTIEMLITQAEPTLQQAKARGSFRLNYSIERTLSAIAEALKPFRDATQQEPMTWAFPVAEPSPPDEGAADVAEERPTEEQKKEGIAALEAAMKEEVTFAPYRIHPDRLPDRLNALTPAREKLSPEALEDLNVNFMLVMEALEMISDEI